MTRQKLRLRRLLLLELCLVLVGISVVTWLIFYTIEKQQHIAEDLFYHPFAVSNAGLEFRSDVLEFRKYMLETMLSHRQVSEERVLRFETQADGHLAIIQKGFLGDQKRVNDIVREMAAWKKIRSHIESRVLAGNYDAALGLAMREASPHLEQIMLDTEYVISFARSRALSFVDEGRARKSQAEMYLTLLVAMSLALYLLISNNLRRGILLIYDMVEHDATFDALTGAFNRRALLKQGATEVKRARRHNHPLSLLMLDLDHFKQINDSHGHDAGDSVLSQFAAICSKGLREEDLFGRIGGEEFVILLPDTDLTGAVEVAERIRLAVAGFEFKIAVGKYQKVTVSVGVALMAGDAGMDTLLKSADHCLYRSKAGGRNCVTAGADG